MRYRNTRILVATKHHKEQVIQPIFKRLIGCHMDVAKDFDSDQFGTFAGEVPRLQNPLTTLIAKATLAAQEAGYDYAIASEGSFGHHPDFFMIPADIELIGLIDLEQGIEIIESVISTETNYAYFDLNSGDNYSAFLKQVQFPSHGLIVRALKTGWIQKGITNQITLKAAIEQAFEQSQQIRLETDMRACFNPSRMTIIAQAAEKLAQRILQHCPQCNSPGFGKLATTGKLLCECCEAPSTLYQFQLRQCVACEYGETSRRPDGLTTAPLQYCNYCNP
jgi:hypothetical protein